MKRKEKNCCTYWNEAECFFYGCENIPQLCVCGGKGLGRDRAKVKKYLYTLEGEWV